MRLLVYDGDCTLCEAASRRLVAWGGVPDERRRSHLAFEGEAFDRLLAAGVHDELAVLEESTGEIRSGVAGILWWMRETRLRRAAALLDRRPFRAALTPLYRLVAYNRRVIAPPPPRPFPCACDPAPHPGYQTAFALGLAGAGLAGVMAAIGAVAWAFAGRPTGAGDLPRLLAWSLLPLGLAALGALPAPPGRRLAALGHRLWPFAAASPLFLSGALLGGILPEPIRAAGVVVPTVLGAIVLARSAARRRRILATWRG